MQKQVTIIGKEYQKVQELKVAGLAEWQAVAQVLNISEETSFVVTVLGTSSSPKEGYIVTFLGEPE